MTQEAHPATTGQPLDLDKLEGDLTGQRTNGLGRPLGVGITLRLVAELRAAREVIKNTAAFADSGWTLIDGHRSEAAYDAWLGVIDALTTYSEAVGGEAS